MSLTVVTTTIHVPTFLSAYARNAKQYGSEVNFIVVGDLKTPPEARGFCATVPNCEYMGREEQDEYLKGFPELAGHLPWNTIARRNVGHLKAYRDGAEAILMLDDDNLATNHDFAWWHGNVGKYTPLPTYESRNGWMNVCAALVEAHGVEFYPRGYPPRMRWRDAVVTHHEDTNTVAANAGLWLNDPDIDALTRLERRLLTTGKTPGWPEQFALQPGTWCPFNCQNTAISRAALPSYFLSPHAGRHLDIWASYVTTRCAEHLGEVVSFGLPLAFHDRSPHNLYGDLRDELPWVEATDAFCDALRGAEVGGRTYPEAFASVIEGLRSGWQPDPAVKGRYVDGLLAWQRTFERLG